MKTSLMTQSWTHRAFSRTIAVLAANRLMTEFVASLIITDTMTLQMMATVAVHCSAPAVCLTSLVLTPRVEMVDIAVSTDDGIRNNVSTIPLMMLIVVVLPRLWQPVTIATTTKVTRT